MKSFATFAIACMASANAMNELEHKFMTWAIKFGKQYETIEEFGERFVHWEKTHLKIEEHNARTFKTSVLGHNNLSDLSDEEYKAMLTWKPKRNGYRHATELSTDNLPDSINWVELGAVNEVQDQAKCGSCWAFSAIASMEGQHFVQSGELLKLSEQQCVDCDGDSMGCSGGW